jgi:hypothetical protein
MTRDEAIKAFRNSTPNPSSFSDEAWIDRFVALGMLKLDEPKSAAQKFADIAYEVCGAAGYAKLWERFEKAGIRVVEK